MIIINKKNRHVKKVVSVVMIIFMYTLVSINICIAEILIVNDGIVGGNINSSIDLIDIVEDEYVQNVSPYKIDICIESGRYVGVVAFYDSNDIAFDEMEKVLGNIYSNMKIDHQNFKGWRDDKRKFAVSLTQGKLCKEKPNEMVILVTYKALGGVEKD